MLGLQSLTVSALDFFADGPGSRALRSPPSLASAAGECSHRRQIFVVKVKAPSRKRILTGIICTYCTVIVKYIKKKKEKTCLALRRGVFFPSKKHFTLYTMQNSKISPDRQLSEIAFNSRKAPC